jgi:hypothetical protein
VSAEVNRRYAVSETFASMTTNRSSGSPITTSGLKGLILSLERRLLLPQFSDGFAQLIPPRFDLLELRLQPLSLLLQRGDLPLQIRDLIFAVGPPSVCSLSWGPVKNPALPGGALLKPNPKGGLLIEQI